MSSSDPLAAIEAKIQAALSAGSGSGGGAKKTPIGGLPADYTVSYRVPYTGQGGAPGQIAAGGGNPAAAYGPGSSVLATQGIQYFNGDEYAKAPTNLQDITTLQKQLVFTGLLDPSGLVWGSWDPKSAAGFSKLLAMSNASGTDWVSTLATRMAAAGADGAVGVQQQQQDAKLPALTISLTNPDDIKAVAQNSAKSLIGQKLGDDELNLFVTNYQNMERQYQTDQYNQQYTQTGVDERGNKLGVPGPGGTATKPAAADTEAENYIKAAQPTQYQATQFGSLVTQALKNLASTGNLG